MVEDELNDDLGMRAALQAVDNDVAAACVPAYVLNRKDQTSSSPQPNAASASSSSQPNAEAMVDDAESDRSGRTADSDADIGVDRESAKQKIGNLPLDVVMSPASSRAEARGGVSSVGKGNAF